MAKRTYKVKKGDSFASLGFPASEVMNLNPGVKKLSTGQTIFLPDGVKAGSKNTTPSTPNLGLYNNSPYRGFQTPTSSTKYVPQFAGMQVQTGQNPIVPPPTAIAIQKPLPVMDGMTPTTSTVYQNANVTPPTQRPTGVYTGGNSATDQQWRDYWNQSAKAGKNEAPTPVHVPTRSEVWEMKARQRRRRQEKGEVVSTVVQPVQPEILQNYGNAVNTALSWRVG